MNSQLIEMGKRAKKASRDLALLSTAKKNEALVAMAQNLLAHKNDILSANQSDLSKATDMPVKFMDRLRLTDRRLQDMADGLQSVAQLSDPVAKYDRGWINHAGLQIMQKRVPLGVIGIIFEARPNVAADATGLTFKSGNAVILRGGKEALRTNEAIVEALREALHKINLPVDAVQLITNTSHELADELMRLTAYVDVLIPRGSQRLIQAVVQQAKVPVIQTGAGNCHIYVDRNANLEMAKNIVVNAKVQRPSVCNAAEKLLIHVDAINELPAIAKALIDHGVQLRGDKRACTLVPEIQPASDSDWDTEYNDLIMAVKVVDSMDEAIKHINTHGTHHSETIVTENVERGRKFQREVDSACVYVNASTRFTDGGEFGFGAEIGISTQKLHARGPMGLDQLTTIKYEITGDGQIRH